MTTNLRGLFVVFFTSFTFAADKRLSYFTSHGLTKKQSEALGQEMLTKMKQKIADPEERCCFQYYLHKGASVRVKDENGNTISSRSS